MIIVLFGPSGTGKTYLAKKIVENIDCVHVEGDDFLDSCLIDSILSNDVHDDQLDFFYKKIIDKCLSINNCIILSQAFAIRKYMDEFISIFPNSVFIYIHTPLREIERRILNRGNWVDLSVARNTYKLFDEYTGDINIKIDNKADNNSALLTLIEYIERFID